MPASFFAHVREQLVYLHSLCGSDVLHLMRQAVVGSVEPVDHTLEVDAERSTHSSEAHPFQVQPNSSFFEGRVMAHGLSVTRRHRDGAMITTIGPPARLSRTPVVPGRPVSPPGGDAAEVLSMIGMADKLNELVEKRVIALD